MSSEDKRRVADALDEIATLLELSGENAFKVRAFSKAAQTIRALDRDIAEMASSGDLDSVRGIGSATRAVVREILDSGRSSKLDSLRAAVPPGLVELTRLSGIGPRNATILHRELSVESVGDLERAVADGRIASVPGLGARASTKIAEALRERRARTGRTLISRAVGAATRIATAIAAIEGVGRVEASGAVRRRCEIIEGITIVVETTGAPDEVVRRAMEADLSFAVGDVAARRIAGHTDEDVPVEIFFIEPDRFSIALFVTTGSSEFLAATISRAAERGVTLTVDGIEHDGRRVSLADETAIFEAIGVPFVPPEQREAASALDLPPDRFALVDTTDLRGTFHVHSTWSDGRSTLREMLAAAKALGLEYVGISDHSKSASYARGLDEARLAEQRAEIDRLRGEFEPMHIFWGTECDILGDGTLDFDAATLAGFDFVIASVHSRFKMPRGEMTARIVRAIRNPFTTFLGHLTGRMLLGRVGCQVDYAPIFGAAAENDVIIEINGSPRRLDLDWRRMREAIDAGVTLSIHPDAHDVGEYGHLLSGVWAARKGGLRGWEVFNTRGVEDVASWLAARKG